MQKDDSLLKLLDPLLIKHRTLVGLDGAYDPEIRAAERLRDILAGAAIVYGSPRAEEYFKQFGQLNFSSAQTILKPETFVVVKL